VSGGVRTPGPTWWPAVSVPVRAMATGFQDNLESGRDVHDTAVIPIVAFQNSPAPAAAVRLRDELAPEPYSAAGGESEGSEGLTAAADEDLEEYRGEYRYWISIPLDVRLAVVRRRLTRLHASIAEQCPGPHEFVKHHEDEPPSCSACGYCDVGLHQSEYGNGKGRRGEAG
jgi:hypothetical protein